MNNIDIVNFFVDEFDNKKKNHITLESIPIDELENHIQLYAELTDIFNDVVISKKGNLLNISVYRTLQYKK